MFVNPKPFPKCTVKAEQDKGYISKDSFICVLASDRFRNKLEVRVCFPYWEQNKNDDGVLEDFYSWSDKDGNIFSHYRDGHGDHESVIDWFPLNDTSPEAVLFREYFKKQEEYRSSREAGEFY